MSTASGLLLLALLLALGVVIVVLAMLFSSGVVYAINWISSLGTRP